MTTTLIRQKLYDYIKVANDKKVKAIYAMLEDNIDETFNPFENEQLISELQKRTNDYKIGKVKGIAWIDAKAQLLHQKK